MITQRPSDRASLIQHYMRMIEAIEKSWLVKANGRVLGPYTKTEIHELLKKKEIVVLNEVISPFRRWQYIRDLEIFADIVEELRVMEFGHNEDHTMTTSQTASVTEKVNDSVIDERTDRIHSGGLKEIVIDHVEEVRSQGPKAHSSSSQYRAHVKDEFIENQSEKLSKTVWYVSIAIILSVIAFVSLKRMNSNSADQKMSGEQHLKRALQHYYAGDYRLALPDLYQAEQLLPHDIKIKSLLVPIMVLLEPEKKDLANQFLDKIRHSPDFDKEQVALLRGLIQLKDKKYAVAREQFSTVLKDNPFSWQAFANLGVVSFLEGDFLSAKNHFESALGVEVANRTSRGEVYLMRAAAEIYLWNNLKSEKYLRDAEAGLDSYLAEFSDYKQEALLLKSFVHFASQQKASGRSAIELMVDTDPLLTEEHSKDPYVDRSPISWAQLLPWCDAIHKGWNDDSLVRAMMAVCLVQNKNKDIEAQTEVGVAVTQSPKDPLVHALYAYITWVLGETSKAEMLVTKAIDLNSSQLKVLPHIVKARICEKNQNYECAVENWQAVKTLDESSVSAMGGLAYSYLKLKKFSLFESAYHEGSKYSRFYKPLLRARVLAEDEGLKIDKK